MRRFMLVLIALVLAMPLGFAQNSAAFVSSDFIPPFVEGEVVVVIRRDMVDGLSKSASAEFEYRHQGALKTLGSVRDSNTTTFTVSVPSGVDMFQFIAELESDPQVLDAEPNWVTEGQGWPNDPWFNPAFSPWTAMNTTEESVEKTQESSTRTIVLVADTGIDLAQADMAGRINTAYARNFVVEGASVQDDNGHGTGMASQIGAIADNDLRLAGAAFYTNIEILPIKVLGADNKGTYEDLIQGLLYASEVAEVEPSLRVVNLSLIGYGGGMAMSDALAQLGTQGIVVAVAAGNFADDNDVRPSYPGAYSRVLPNVLSVGGLTGNGLAIAGFSNFGDESVTFFAPGGGTAIYLGGVNSGTAGTSSSAAFTSAMLAIVLGRNPEYTFWQARQQLIQTLTPREFLVGRCKTGGALNMHDLVTQNPDLLPTDEVVARKVSWSSKNGGTLKVTVDQSPEALIYVIGHSLTTKIKKNGQHVLQIAGVPSPPKGQTSTITIISSLGDIEQVSFRKTGGVVSLVASNTSKGRDNDVSAFSFCAIIKGK